MKHFIAQGGVWKEIKKAFVAQGGAWHEIKEGYIAHGGAWKQYLASALPPVDIAIAANTLNANLRAIYDAGGHPAPASGMLVTFTINAGEGTFYAVDSERAEAVECLDECAFTLTVAWPPATAGTAPPRPTRRPTSASWRPDGARGRGHVARRLRHGRRGATARGPCR